MNPLKVVWTSKKTSIVVVYDLNSSQNLFFKDPWLQYKKDKFMIKDTPKLFV